MDGKTSVEVTYKAGKVAALSRRRENAAEVQIGFRYLPGNGESYFYVTGKLWNRRRTDCIMCGCGTAQYIFSHFCQFDMFLALIVELGDKWHLTRFSKIPATVKRRIFEVMRHIDPKVEL